MLQHDANSATPHGRSALATAAAIHANSRIKKRNLCFMTNPLRDTQDRNTCCNQLIRQEAAPLAERGEPLRQATLRQFVQLLLLDTARTIVFNAQYKLSVLFMTI
jgi:hypothetical protein